jgi:hypothetical protein
MKRITSQLLVILLIAAVAAPLAAQQQNKKKKQPTLVERTLKRFAKAELTEEQTAKIKELATAAEPKLVAAKKKAALTAEQRQAMTAARKKAADDGLKGKAAREAVQAAGKLTDEQKEGLAEQRALTLKFNKATIGLLSEEQRTKAGVKLPGAKKKKKKTENK